MESAEIARRFLSFFEQRGHAVVPSASLIAEDPTLLLVNAGMVPFKPYFLGQRQPPWRRATSAQKCVRTPDIEEVGKTTRHATFFQMMGNFSFGDYFKEGAIPFAWELLTSPESKGGFGFPEDRLWATVYHDDDEAARIWRDVVGVPESRIQRRGLADNYWHMGVPGPGGPCSEIYYDRGPEYGREGGPEADEDRYLEVWNLVFMQETLSAVRSKVDFDITGPLPSRNIDTGMGLERMAILLQGVDNIYEIDTMWKVLDRAAELTEQKYGRDHRADVSLRVVADHVRTAVMLVADGVTPTNEGRGYVLRRILRRTIRNMRLLSGAQRGGAGGSVSRGGADERYMHELTSVAISALGEQYADLVRDAPQIHAIIDAEEAAFLSTLRTGTAIFEAAVEETKRGGGEYDPRQPGVPAARHLRLPDRPDPGDGRRAGPGGRRGRVPPADGGAAGPGQGRRGGQEDRQRRHLGLHADPGGVRPGRVHRLRRDRGRRDGHRPARRTGSRCPRRARAAGSTWCWTGPRSTPRAAASSPTPARSRPPAAARARAPWSRCRTSRRRCRG